jgi:hypothetical protein
VTSPDRLSSSPDAPAPSGAPVEPRVGELLARVRAGVRQRQSELATLSGGEELKLRLLELKTLEYVEEPVAYSPRPVVGRLLVFVRKAVFHLFVKWTARPVRERQNRFNQVAGQLIHEMSAREARLAEALEKAAVADEALAARLQALEERLALTTLTATAGSSDNPAGGPTVEAGRGESGGR